MCVGLSWKRERMWFAKGPATDDLFQYMNRRSVVHMAKEVIAFRLAFYYKTTWSKTAHVSSLRLRISIMLLYINIYTGL